MSQLPPDPMMPPPIPPARPPVIPYATPEHLAKLVGIWREGKRVIVTHNNPNIPHCCFICANPPSIVKRTVLSDLSDTRWQFRRKGIVHIPICEHHRKLMFWSKASAWILGFGTIALLCVGIPMYMEHKTEFLGEVLLLLSVVFLFLTSIFGLIGKVPARATHIDPTYITLKGAGKPFLDLLPPI